MSEVPAFLVAKLANSPLLVAFLASIEKFPTVFLFASELC